LSLGVIGAFALIISRKSADQGLNVLYGDFLIIVNAICYSYYFILVKPLMKRYSPLDVLRVCFTLGTIIALPFCWSDFSETPWMQYDTKAVILLLTVVVGGTFLAYLFNIFGIKHLGASISGAYIYSQPVFATMISMIFMNEKIDLTKIIAAVCIFAGVYLATKKSSDELENADVDEDEKQ
jgi:drug/metabolite transporter (DMT)-like permease